MNRWEALVAVVRAFRPHERPFTALIALAFMLGALPAVGVAVVALIK
jgi:hypothetical protein